MDSGHHCERFGILWYFYNENPLLQTLSLINRNYEQLGINVDKVILRNPQDLRAIPNSDIWKRTTITKVAIPGSKHEKWKSFYKIKKLEGNQSDELEMKKEQYSRLSEINQFLANEPNIMPQYYVNKKELDELVQRSYQQMKAFKQKQILSEKFLSICKEEWKLFESFVVKFFACKSDQFLTKNSQENYFYSIFEQTKNQKLVNAQANTLAKYENDFRVGIFVRAHLKDLNVEDNCERVGYSIRMIYPEIKNAYLKEQEYQRMDEIIGWKLIPTPLDFRKYEKGQLFLHKTIQNYRKSCKPLLQNLHQNINDKMTIIKIILKRSGSVQQSQQNPNFNHGYCISEQGIIFINCMNILVLKKVQEKKIPDLIDEQSIEFNQKLDWEDKTILVFQFELTSYSHIMKACDSLWLKKSFRSLMNFLESRSFTLKIEEAYIRNHEYDLAEKLLLSKEKVNQQFDPKLWRIMGKEQNLLKIAITQHSSLKQLKEGLEFYKELHNMKQYLRYLTIYHHKLRDSRSIIEKYGKSGQISLQISLQIGLNLGDRQDYMVYLNQVKKTIDQLSPHLSHRLQRPKLIKQKQLSCFERFFSKNEKQVRPDRQIKDQINEILGRTYFQGESPNSQIRSLEKLKFMVCQLWRSLKFAVEQIYCYGRRCKELLKLKSELESELLNKDIEQIEFMVKFNDSAQKSRKIRELNLNLRDFCDMLTQNYEKLSVISNYPLKEGTMAQSSIIRYKKQDLDIIDWESTKISLESMIGDIQSANKEIDESYSIILSIEPDKRDSQTLDVCLSICSAKISHLRENHYSNNSIDLLILFKRQVELFFRLKDITGLEMVLQKNQFPSPNRANVIIFLAETHQKIALLSFEHQDFDRCLLNINKSLLFLKKLSPNVSPRKIINLHLLQLRAKMFNLKLKLLTVNSVQNNQIVMKQKQKLRPYIKGKVQNWKELVGQENAIIYVIQANLIDEEIRNITKQGQRLEETVKNLERIKDSFIKYYEKLNINVITINIQILKLYHEKRKLKEAAAKLTDIYEQIDSFFDQKMHKQQSLLKKCNWIKNLSLFFKQQAKELRYIDLLPARKYIERCLVDFNQLKQKQLLTIQLRDSYRKIYDIYSKFMKRTFSYFPKKANILDVAMIKNEPIIQHELLPQQFQSEYSHYKKIYWIIFVQQVDPQQQSQINRAYNNGSEYTYSPFVSSYDDFTRKNRQIWSQHKSINHGVTIYPSIKLLIQQQFLREMVIKEQINQIAEVCDLSILINQNQDSCISEIQAYLLRQRIDKKLKIVKDLSQQIHIILDDASQLSDRVSMNTLFYLQPFKEKIYKFHTIMLTSLSEQQYDLQFKIQQNPTSLSKLKRDFLSHYRGTLNQRVYYQYLQFALILKTKRNDIFNLEQGKNGNIGQQLLQTAFQITECYQAESMLYPFVNNTIRTLYSNMDLEWTAVPQLVYPLYHSISFLHEHQFKKNKQYLGKKLILWRKVQMSRYENSIYEQASKDKLFVQFYSFLSTSKSLNWVINQLQKQYSKEKQSMFNKFVIFKIQVEITKQLLDSPMNTGFCLLRNQSQQQLLFNVQNCFMIKDARTLSIQKIMKQNYENVSTNNIKLNISSDFQKSIQKSPIRFIEFQMKDFSKILDQRYEKKSHLYFFQQSQLATTKKRRKHQIIRNCIKISTFGTIEAYEDLGQPQKAKEKIEERLTKIPLAESPSDFLKLVRLQSENMVCKAAQNCLKMGNVDQAKRYILNYLPAYEKSKQRLMGYSQKLKLEDDLFEMKLALFQIYFEDVDLSLYENHLINIHEQLKLIKPQNDAEAIKKSAKEIFMLIYNSIHYFQIQQVKKSIHFLQKALQNMQRLVQKIKQKRWTYEQFIQRDKIQEYCKKIIHKLNDRLSCNSALNKNVFGSQNQQLSVKLFKVMKQYYSTQQSQANDPLSNAVCVQFAVQNIGSQQNDNFDLISETTEEIGAMAKTCEDIEEESLLSREPPKVTLINKDNNMRLLQKLESHRSQVYNASAKGMSKVLDRYYQMAVRLLKNQIRQLEKEGHKRASLPLVRMHNRMIKQRMAKGKFSLKQLVKQINKNVQFCQKGNASSKIEVCRSKLLRAELYYRSTQDQLFRKGYKELSNNDQLYANAEKSLEEAEQILKQAYNIRQSTRNLGKERESLERLYQWCDENIEIHVLRLKIKHSQYQNRQTSKQCKDNLMLSLKQLGAIVTEKKLNYDMLNQEIIVHQFCCIYGLMIPRQISFQPEVARLMSALRLRTMLRGQINNQNAGDCLQLFEILQSGLQKRINGNIIDCLYGYIQAGARNVENNDLFWRFVICKFHRISKRNNSEEDYILRRLKYIEEVFMMLKDYGKVKQRVIIKIYEAFTRFKKSINDKIRLSAQFPRKIVHIQKLYNELEQIIKAQQSSGQAMEDLSAVREDQQISSIPELSQVRERLSTPIQDIANASASADNRNQASNSLGSINENQLNTSSHQLNNGIEAVFVRPAKDNIFFPEDQDLSPERQYSEGQIRRRERSHRGSRSRKMNTRSRQSSSQHNNNLV